MPDSATQIFLAHRNLLFTIGYQILGSAADVEDVLQETWLRWVKVDLAQVVDQAPWLPEPADQARCFRTSGSFPSRVRRDRCSGRQDPRCRPADRASRPTTRRSAPSARGGLAQ